MTSAMKPSQSVPDFGLAFYQSYMSTSEMDTVKLKVGSRLRL